MAETLTLKPGSRVRTGGATYEVKTAADLPADFIPVTPQPTRLLKVYCPSCGYTCRITHKWIAKTGTPVCPGLSCPDAPMVVDGLPKAEKAMPATGSPKPAAEPEPIAIPEPIAMMDEGDTDTELARLLAELV